MQNIRKYSFVAYMIVSLVLVMNLLMPSLLLADFVSPHEDVIVHTENVNVDSVDSVDDVDVGTDTSFPVDYDPNEGKIKYGYSGQIGMRRENDTNNFYTKKDNVVRFPSAVIGLRDERGKLLFKDYSADNPYYDYSDMLNKALEIARNNDNADVFIEDGVYYFAKSIYLWGSTSINATAGKVAFVVKPNFQDKDGNPVDVNGFFTNANLNETYSWYSSAGLTDIVFVVEGTHHAFRPNNSVENIMAHLCDDDIEAVDNFNLFYRVRMAYSGIGNIGVAGFESFMRWTFVDMLTRVVSVTVGPTKYVYYGVQTNDAFFYDNHYYGGYYTDSDGLAQLPLFQINFSMGTTMFTNSYIGNYYFSRSGAGCWCPHTTYSNLTLERIYNFVMDTTTSSSSSVSGCYFKDCAYNDIANYFEKQGIPAFDYWDRTWSYEQNKYIYNSKGYIIRDIITGNKHDSANHAHGQFITLFELHGGISFTQNKIECDSLDWTTLIRLTDSGWTSRYTMTRGAKNITFADNAFKINHWVKASLMIDDWEGGKPYSDGWYDNTVIAWGERGWNNDDGTPAMGWVGVDGGEPVSWLVDYIYVSPYYSRYIDLTAFSSPDAKTAGYTQLGDVGANEDALHEAGIEDQYFYDLNNPDVEKVYLEKDFGAFSWSTGSSHQNLQSAFDYVATHDAILYIEEGTFYTTKPIVLRGGATYRVVFNGTIKTYKSTDVDSAGLFVMSADDNTPINGYFVGVDLSLHTCNTSAFFNVNTDNFYFQMRSVQRAVGCFTNCKLQNTIIHDGAIQYCDYGFFYKTVTNNTLVKNVYGTASTWQETADGISPGDINYRYFISSSDFTHSTWRGCWLEFGQFSNGKTLTGEGNSIYRGNLIDYTYNYSFGRNDVFCGNTLTRASYSNIANHMVNSNFPIDLPDILTNQPMVMFHVSDGLRLIGNMDIGTMNEMTHFVEFDSPSISYHDENGNVVKSISNVRILGNGVTTEHQGDYKVKQTYIPWGKAHNLVVENCQNNVIDLLQFYEFDVVDDPETEEDETFIVPRDELIVNAIPYTRFYVNGELITIDYPTSEEQELTQIVVQQPLQDKIYDVPNKWSNDSQEETLYRLYDFRNGTDTELSELKNTFAAFIDYSTVNLYNKSSSNYAVLPDSNNEIVNFTYDMISVLPEEQRYQIIDSVLEYDVKTSPTGYSAFYMNQSRDKLDFDSVTNHQNNLNKPTFVVAFDDEEISGDNLVSVTGGLHHNFRFSMAWLGKRQIVLVHSQDAENYYGVAVGYGTHSCGLFTVPCSIKKGYLHDKGSYSDAGNTGVSLNINNRTNQLLYDPFGNLTNPVAGYHYGVCGDYTEIPMFDYDIQLFESLIFGMDFTMKYDHDYDTVTIYANIDFSNGGEDKSVENNPPLKATKRKVWFGTFPLNGKDEVFGIWGGDETWIESLQFGYVAQKEQTCSHANFTKILSRRGSCTTDSMIKYTCADCGYCYEELLEAVGHHFTYEVQNDGSTLRKCQECGFKCLSPQMLIDSCNHVYDKNVIVEVDCHADGVYQYTCNQCNDTYIKIIDACHDYIDHVVKPNLIRQGYTKHICQRCGYICVDNYTDVNVFVLFLQFSLVYGILFGVAFYFIYRSEQIKKTNQVKKVNKSKIGKGKKQANRKIKKS